MEQTLLMRLGNSPGPHVMAILIQAALDAACLAVGGQIATCELFSGLMNCLPPACRTFFSFSTGLKFSLRRPFHLIALSGDPGEQRWLAHQNNVTVLDLSGDKPLPPIPLDGWAQFIERVMAAGQTSFLAAQLAKRRFDLKLEDLSALGLQLLEELETSTFEDWGRRLPSQKVRTITSSSTRVTPAATHSSAISANLPSPSASQMKFNRHTRPIAVLKKHNFPRKTRPPIWP